MKNTLIGVIVAVLSFAFARFMVNTDQPKPKSDVEQQDLPQLMDQIFEETVRSIQLDEERVEVGRHLAECNKIMADLFAERVSLLQAAARFRTLNRETRCNCHDLLPGNSEEERLCRQVLRWAHAWREGHDSETASELVSELDAELEWYLETGVPIELPEQS